MDTTNKIPEALATSYEALIEPTRIRFRDPINQEIDMRKMTVVQAELIASHRPDVLVKKEKAVTVSKSKATE